MFTAEVHQSEREALSRLPLTKFTMVVAATIINGIGKNHDLPWRIKQDMQYFKRVTTRVPQAAIEAYKASGNDPSKLKNAVIMGRVTWESVPVKMRPLSDRFNIVISHNASYLDNTNHPKDSVVLSNTLLHALQQCQEHNPRTFIVGGAQIYDEAMELPQCERVLLTRIKRVDGQEIDCDTFFPDIPVCRGAWRRATHQELCNFVGEDVPEGEQEDGQYKWEYIMYERVQA